MARIKEVAREQRRREGSVASATAETIGSIRTVQALSLQSRFMDIFSVANRRSLQAGNKAQQLSAGLERVIDLLATSTTALVLWFGVRNVLKGQLTPGDLIVFTTYLRTGFKPIRQLAKYLGRSEEHTSELQSRQYLVCRLLLEKKKRGRSRRSGGEKIHTHPIPPGVNGQRGHVARDRIHSHGGEGRSGQRRFDYIGSACRMIR